MRKPPKRNGRVKGSQNKASKSLREALEQKDFSIADEIVKLYQEPDLPLNTKVRLLETLIQYTHPRLKEAEAPIAPEPTKDVPAKEATTESLLALVKQ